MEIEHTCYMYLSFLGNKYSIFLCGVKKVENKGIYFNLNEKINWSTEQHILTDQEQLYT